MKIKSVPYLLTLTTLLFLEFASTAKAESWKKLPGCGTDIGVGRDRSAWVLGCASGGNGGNEIYRWNGTAWQRVDGAATNIAVSPEGTPWVVAADGTIWNRKGSSWQQVAGCGKDIGVGTDDTAWVLGCASGGNGGYEIYRWNDNAWEKVDGAALRIAVSPGGIPWVVSSDGTIWKR